MKLFSSIAAAAVIGASFIAVNPAEAEMTCRHSELFNTTTCD